MIKKNFFYAFAFAFTFLFLEKTKAQSILDISVGTSHQDKFFGNLAYRYQINEKLRIGFESQFASPKYRFIDAKVIKTGYVATTSIPLTVRLYQKQQIRLDLYTRVGARFLGVIDPDGNDKPDSVLNATAFVFESGLLITVQLNDGLNFQSGFTFPVFYQIQPSGLLENVYVPIVHLGLNQKIGSKNVLFIKTAFGAAVGGDGDTQKFGKTIQAGIRFNLGSKKNPTFVEPSF